MQCAVRNLKTHFFTKDHLPRAAFVIGVFLFSFTKLSAQYTTTICSGDQLNYAPLTSPFKYKWTVDPSSSSSINGTPQTVLQLSINPTLTNSDPNPKHVIFNVIGDDGTTQTPFTLDVTVNPIPQLSNGATADICSGGAAFTFSPTSNTTGVTYNWARQTNANITTTGTASGTGTINDNLTNVSTNHTTQQELYYYTLSLTANGATCSSNLLPVSVNVFPMPSLSSNITPTPVCSGRNFTYVASSMQSPVNYSWSRPVTAGISNTVTSGSGKTISEVLNNTTTGTISVDYTLTLTANGCVNTETVTVDVKPTPGLASVPIATSCSGTMYTFSATSTLGAGTSYSWFASAPAAISASVINGTGDVADILTNNSTTAASVTFSYTLSKNSCSSDPITFTVLVNPLPQLTSNTSPSSVCSAIQTVQYSATANQDPNVSYSWTRAAVANISPSTGSGPTETISEVLTNASTQSINVVYNYSLHNTLTGCNNTQNITVAINPIPNITNHTITICNNNGFLYAPPTAPIGTTYTWTVTPDPSITTNGTNPPASQSVGQLYVNEPILKNSSGTIASAVYHVSPNLNGCTGSIFDLTVDVNAGISSTVTLDPATPAPICSGVINNFVFSPTSSAFPGATFTWQRFQTTGISNLPSNGSGIITETLVNTTNSPVVVSYAITVSAPSACSSTYIVTVQVNPSITLTSLTTKPAQCSNTVFSYTPTTNTAATSVIWSRALIAGISNVAANGSGNINETLINTTTGQVNVNYSYTLTTAAGCTSNITVSVAINPSPVLSSTLTASPICSNGLFSYTPTSATGGASFSWVRSSNPSITNPASFGPGNPNEILISTSINPVTLTYTYTITANTCQSTQDVSVTVNPVASVALQTLTVCSGQPFSLTPSNVPAGTQYTWSSLPASVPAGAISGGATGTLQNSIFGTLTNGTVNNATANYTVTPIGTCTGLSFTVAVTVRPTPSVSSVTISPTCSGTAFTFTPTVPSGTTYTWGNPLGSITGGSAQSGVAAISQTLFSAGTLSSTATYSITPANGTCTGAAFTLTVTINPTPSVSSNLTTSSCSGIAFSALPSPVPASTAFTWILPVNFPAGSISGAIAQPGPVTPISQTLINTLTTTAQTLYSVTPIAGTCTGSVFTLTVTTNPATQLSSTLTPSAVCSNTLLSYTPTSNTSTTVFGWTRPVVAGISNGIGNGSGSPNETLINTTAAPVSVGYTYILTTAAGCTNTQTVTVTVNPTPVLTSSINPFPVFCSGSNFNYTPTSATTGTVFNWNRNVSSAISNGVTSGTGNPAQVLINSSINLVPITYTYTLTANGCSNNQDVAIVVRPVPVVTSQVIPSCSNVSFILDPGATPGAVPVGTQYTWASPVSTPSLIVTGGAAGSLQNNITGTLTNSTLNPATATYTITPAANACSGTAFTLTVTVNPVPVANDVTITAVCSGSPFSYTASGIAAGTTYSWTNPVTPNLNGGSPQSSQTSISQTLSSSNNIANNAIYTVTPSANGCDGHTFQLTVPVNPTPVVNAITITTCSGVAFSVTPNPVPVGTTYTWAPPVTTPAGSVTGSSGNAIAASNISQTLSTASSAVVQTVYSVVPLAGSCAGPAFNLTIGINPGTQLSTSITPPAICSNNIFSYAAASNTPGTSFNWTRNAVPGVSNAAGAGSGNPNETLINITTAPVNVTYVYDLVTSAGCNNTQTVTVAVNPTPILTSLLNAPAICSGAIFNYTPTSATTGTIFNWSRSTIVYISNAPATGSGNPAERLISTSVNAIPVDYNYTLTANGCSNNQVVTVPINPTPDIADQSVATCSNTAFIVEPGNAPAGTTYTWGTPVINPAGSITGSTAQTSAQNNFSQLLTNQTLNNALAIYTVSPVAGACPGSSFAIDVTVKPLPFVGNQVLTAACSGATFSYTPSGVPTGTTYTWSNPILNPANGLTGGAAQSISQSSISQTLTSSNNLVNTAIYTVLPSRDGCPGNSFTLTVPVNPTPVVNNIVDTICTSTSFSIAPSPVPSNTTYTWTAPVNFPFGSIIGGTAQATPATTISQTLINTTGAAAQAVYTVTPKANTCTGAPFTVTVVVGVVLPAIDNQAVTICSGTAFNATPINAPPGTTYTWGNPVIAPPDSLTGTSAMSTPQTAISQTLNNLAATNRIAVYSVTAHNTGCNSNVFTAMVTVLMVPRATVTGKPVICRYPYDTLSISFIGQSPWGFTYIDQNIPHTISGINVSPYSLLVPASGISSRIIAITNIAHYACTDIKDTIFFSQTINPLPVGIIHSLHGQYLCNNIADTLFVTSPDSLGYQWTRNGTILTGSTDDTLVTGLAGRYNVILTNQFGCIDTAAVMAGLTKVNQPLLRMAYDTYCINTVMNFTNFTDTNTTGPIQWLWDFGNGVTKAGYHSNNTYVTGGDHHIVLKATQVYCPANPTTLDTTINIKFPIAGVTLPLVSAYKGLFTPVSGRSFPGYRYQWTPSWGISQPDSSQTLFNYANTQQYVINLISPAGCITGDSLLVRVFDDGLVNIMVPKSFTPNGDGINDILYPYLAGIKEFHYFKVYNRFNQLMFDTRNYDAGWNGMVNGVPQPMAIYIWMAEGIANDGSLVQKTGQVLLLR